MYEKNPTIKKRDDVDIVIQRSILESRLRPVNSNLSIIGRDAKWKSGIHIFYGNYTP